MTGFSQHIIGNATKATRPETLQECEDSTAALANRTGSFLFFGVEMDPRSYFPVIRETYRSVTHRSKETLRLNFPVHIHSDAAFASLSSGSGMFRQIDIRYLTLSGDVYGNHPYRCVWMGFSDSNITFNSTKKNRFLK